MRKNRVRKWYIGLVLTAIIMSVVVVGALGIYTLWGKSKTDVETVMNLTTEAKAAELDYVLLKIEDAVDTVSAYTSARVVTTGKEIDQNAIDGGLDEDIQELFMGAVDNMEGVVGYYVCFASPYSSMVDGIAYRRSSDEAAFYVASEDGDIGDLKFINEEDDWFTLAASNRRPVCIPIREC